MSRCCLVKVISLTEVQLLPVGNAPSSSSSERRARGRGTASLRVTGGESQLRVYHRVPLTLQRHIQSLVNSYELL